MADQPDGGDGGDNIVIRTMKDDLTSTGAKPAPKLPAVSTGQFPLSPRPASMAAPTVPAPFQSTPNVTRRNRRRLFLWLGGGVGILILVIGGFWAFVTFVSAPAAPQETQEGVVASVNDIIPTSAGLAVHYSLETPTDRSDLLELWQNSTKTLLQGNPKTLLSDANVKEFMYVGIPGQSRPFLVIPKKQLSEQLLPDLRPEQVLEKSGWYVVHALNVSPYEQALTQGIGLGGDLAGALIQKTAGRPLNIYTSELALNQIRSSSAGEPFTAGSVKRALLSAGPASGQNGISFEGFGEISPATSEAPARRSLGEVGKADQALLAAIPADASFVRLGSNLESDVATWESLTHVLDAAVLEQSAVAALLKQVTGPYAYYQRLGVDGVEDIGLLVKLPPEITPPLALGDPTLEQGLSALVPLILPAKPVSLPAFADGVYAGLPLRFANLVGSTKALDYTIQNNLMIFSTSKEGMFSALDVATKKTSSLETSPPWQTLLTVWGAAPVTPELFLGYLNFSSLLDLLPTSQTKLPFGLTQETGSRGLHLTGVLMF